MGNRLLTVDQLSIRFSGERQGDHVVRNLSFNVDRGKVMGMVGESGSGKSITSLAIMQLLPPQAVIGKGSILFNDPHGEQTDLVQLSEPAMQTMRGRKISMIFQEPMTSLNPAFTCGMQVKEVMDRHLQLKKKETEKLVLEWFERVKLPDPTRAYGAYPHQLSGGQRQRVMIAMAMCCQPDLLIADEPTTALDVTVQKTILDLMMELQKQFGMSILFITHDLGVIREVADEVMVMYKGEKVEEGPVQQVLHSPAHPYTQGLIGCRPPVDRKLHHLPVMKDFLDSTGRALKTLKHEHRIGEEEREAFKKKTYSRPPILEVKNLRTDFVVKTNFIGKAVEFYSAVDDVSFNLYTGETLGLVGESGCGKTTLGRSILQLVERSEGNIMYNGQKLDISGAVARKAFRKKIQIVFQDPYSSLNPRMTIGDIILEPMIVHSIRGGNKERAARVRELLEQVGLPGSAYHKYPHQFSGGQRQRIGIARALALEPEIIICDESVSALDMSVQAQVLNLLNDLKQQYGLTYLFISHDLSVVKFMSDRIIVMRNGKIEEIGDSEEVYAHPQSEYTQKLIASVPRLD